MILLFLTLILTALSVAVTVRLRRLRGARVLRPIAVYSAVTFLILAGPSVTHTSAAPWAVGLLALCAYLGANVAYELRLRHRSPGYRAYRAAEARRANTDRAIARVFREQTAANLARVRGTEGKGPRRNVS